jgi:hypothetical protein
MSSMLRIGADFGGLETPPLILPMEACRGAGSSDMSNMLRTGDLGVGKGEEVLPPEPVELAEPRWPRGA